MERSGDVRFYVVWLNQRPTDARETIDATTLADRRVRQHWDGDGITGIYFAETDVAGMGYAGFVYDVYYVFGPDAAWADELPPPSGAGGPVVYEVEKLLAELRAQL